MSLLDAKLLWRDWRGGQLSLIISALVLAVTVVTAIGLLADRVERGVNQQISSFLAADLALQGGVDIPDKYQQQAIAMQLETAKTVSFRSMVFAGSNNHLASIKAVQANYPLRGLMQVASANQADALESVPHGPAVGEIWVEPRLLRLLEIDLGDSIEIGYSNLVVTRLLIRAPDQGTSFAFAGARIIMSYQDLAETQLIRPGSRAKHALLLAGDEQQIDEFKSWYQQQADNNESVHTRLQTPQGSEQRLSEVLQRGQGFLLLSGTIGVLFAGLAMALASHRYANRLTDQVALMKAWGQSSRRIRRSHLVRLLMIAIVSTLLGLLFGWLAHAALLGVVNELFSAQLPSPSWRPWLVASVTGLVCVIGFALPALWHLPSIAPLKVLRRDLPNDLVSQSKRLVVGILTLLFLTIWYSGSIAIALLFLVALFALFAVCALIAMQILKLVKRFGQWRGSYVRLGLANLWRRRAQTLVQLVGFSITLMLLLVVIGMRTNLIGEWQAQLPEDTPSHFIFNVRSNQLDSVQQLLAQEHAKAADWYPMVRGRLVGLNGQPLTKERLRQADGLEREVNFTQAATMPSDNVIVAGQWWDNMASGEITEQANQFSMEQEVAEELGVTVGDELEFSVGGLTFSATLSSIRTVNWQNMTPNFYIIFNPGVLDRFSPNWITAVNKKQNAQTDSASSAIYNPANFVTTIAKQFPTIVLVELNAVIQQVRTVISRVTQGLEMILFLVLLCGALVLFAVIGVTFDERLRENAVLRTLGSSQKMIIGALTTEFAVLGAIAGLIAGMGAELILYFVQKMVFDMQPQWHPQLWLYGVSIGIVVITVLGLLRSREIITVPPLQSLRQIS